MGLPRPSETRWGSHYKTICNIIAIYPSIHEVLVTLGDDPSHKADWIKIHFMVRAFESFEFVVAAHLMFAILGYTNELSECLQRREQDTLVNVAKNRILSTTGWEQFLESELLCFATNMVSKFQLWRIIMCLMENQHVMLGTKQMMIAS
jgi:hypothetical protein